MFDHPAHDAAFDNKYMKLFDALIILKLIPTLMFLNEILETTSYFVLQPWCIKPTKVVLDQKNDRTDASVYNQLFMEIRDGYREYIPVYTDGSRGGNYVVSFHQTW